MLLIQLKIYRDNEAKIARTIIGARKANDKVMETAEKKNKTFI